MAVPQYIFLTSPRIPVLHGECPMLNEAAIHKQQQFFCKVLHLFSKCHNTYDKAAVTDTEIDSLGKLSRAHTQCEA